MNRPTPGHYVRVTGSAEPFEAFVPAPLPPEPPLVWPDALRQRFDEAHLALGRLDALTEHLPNAALVLFSFVRKEAVLSSQIEGTRSTLADLLLYEVDGEPGVPLEDVREVSRCVAALEHGLMRLRGGFPLCVRLMREMHEILMRYPGSEHKTPGELRRSQVWLGGTRPGNAAFVPPPADEVGPCLDALERFLNDRPTSTSPLLKAGLAHVQFETIHPFLDGNGRIGRLLIVLQLVADGILREPMFYPSLYFKAHRTLYYDRLDAVRRHGQWEEWLEFFADAVLASATQAAATATDLLALVNADRDQIAGLGRAAASALDVHQALERQPVATSASLGAATGLTAATVNKALAHLERLGIVVELTQRQRGRVFSYRSYVQTLSAEPEAEPWVNSLSPSPSGPPSSKPQRGRSRPSTTIL